ncbi:ABC transporter permease [Halobacillus fulvus]|nr:ABC transporter permease [Halobacillus fulvus]
MTFSFQRVYAIFSKDLKDLSKNLYVSTAFFLPLFYAFMLGRIEGAEASYLIPLITNMTLASVGAYIQAAIIAEEKEKGTLRGLMLSPASTAEILTGKSVLSVLISVIVTAISWMILDVAIDVPIAGWAGFALLFVFYVALGTLLGLLAKTLIEASIIILPVIFILGMGSMFQGLLGDSILVDVLTYLPNMQAELLFQVEGSGEMWQALGLIAAWTVLTVGLAVVVYKKRMVDE